MKQPHAITEPFVLWSPQLLWISPFLPDIVAIFCLSIGVLLVCHQIKIPPIVGFLLTGVLCGPTALGLVQNPHAVELLAEIGVVLLLFSIGLEMSGGKNSCA